MKERGLHILEALDNLNTLVDADSLGEIEVTPDSLLIGHKGERQRELYWVQAGGDDQTVHAVKDTFRAVHSYLRTFYGDKKKIGDIKKLVQGINTIMVLVGEAAKNLERLSSLFKNKVTEFQEYKKLQNFYRNRVIKEAFSEFAKAPIIKEAQEKLEVEDQLEELFEEEEIQESGGIHLLNDLDLIKRDHLYELFYLKNEAGHNFYTYELARSIKLGCDFGEFAKEYFGEDPLLQIKSWEDKALNLSARFLLKSMTRKLEQFVSKALKYKSMAFVSSALKMIQALMLASNPRNLIRQFSYKGCHLYFQDFLFFLREILESREYQKFLIYSPPLGQPIIQDTIDLVDGICAHLFTLPSGYQEIAQALKQMVERKSGFKTGKLSEVISPSFSAISEVLKKHPNGPLFKAVDVIREENGKCFDPLHQGNIPSWEWSINWAEEQIKVLRIPCPIVQQVINKAYVHQEFKNFLRSLGAEEKLLYIDFQDKTSWKEYARSVALEELGRQAEFAENFFFISLAKDTEFYNQTGHYQEEGHAKTFIHNLIDHLQEEISGYFFPASLKKELFADFIQELMAKIHGCFFDKKSSLTFLERLDFIEIAYQFIELKLIDLVRPAYLCLASKDGLDISGTTFLGLIALLSCATRTWSASEAEKLVALLFAPTFMQRERAIHPERFARLITVIQLLEKKGSYLQEFTSLFSKEVLKAEVILTAFGEF